MNALHVIDRLPLWIEGDLPEAEARRTSEHLSVCADCRAAAEALRESQSWLKDTPPAPFDEDDFRRLRNSVLEQLAAQKQPSARPKVAQLPYLGPALATAAALLLILLTPWIRKPAGSSRAEPEKRVASSSNPGLPVPPAEARMPVQVRGIRPPPPPSHRPVATPAKAGGQEIPDEIPITRVRIELQTSNPAVRIIWLPRGPSGPPSINEQSRLS